MGGYYSYIIKYGYQNVHNVFYRMQNNMGWLK